MVFANAVVFVEHYVSFRRTEPSNMKLGDVNIRYISMFLVNSRALSREFGMSSKTVAHVRAGQGS